MTVRTSRRKNASATGRYDVLFACILKRCSSRVNNRKLIFITSHLCNDVYVIAKPFQLYFATLLDREVRLHTPKI